MRKRYVCLALLLAVMVPSSVSTQTGLGKPFSIADTPRVKKSLTAKAQEAIQTRFTAGMKSAKEVKRWNGHVLAHIRTTPKQGSKEKAVSLLLFPIVRTRLIKIEFPIGAGKHRAVYVDLSFEGAAEDVPFLALDIPRTTRGIFVTTLDTKKKEYLGRAFTFL